MPSQKNFRLVGPPRLKSWIRPWYRIRLTICIQWGSWGGARGARPPSGKCYLFWEKIARILDNLVIQWIWAPPPQIKLEPSQKNVLLAFTNVVFFEGYEEISFSFYEKVAAIYCDIHAPTYIRKAKRIRLTFRCRSALCIVHSVHLVLGV